MLLLSRNIGEEIVITLDNGEVIRIGVTRLHKAQATIAVQADRRHGVWRLEVYNQMQSTPIPNMLQKKQKKGSRHG